MQPILSPTVLLNLDRGSPKMASVIELNVSNFILEN